MKGMVKSIVFMLVSMCFALTAGTAAAGSGKLYMTSNAYNAVFQANLDGTGLVNLGNPGGLLQGAGPIALDPVHGKMYVVTGSNKIIQANMDGTGAVDLGHLNGAYGQPYGPTAIALDAAAGKMYVLYEFVYWWNHYYGGFVTQANLDGTGAVSFGPIGSWTCGIAMDTVNNKLNVSSYGVTNPYNYKVEQMNSDGTGRVRLYGLDGLLFNPMGMALDTVRGKLYVANNAYYNQRMASVVVSNLDGTGAVNLGNLNGLVSYPVAVALDTDAGKMYVLCSSAQWNNATVVQANLDGTDPVVLSGLSGMNLGSIAVLPSLDVPFASFMPKADIDRAAEKFNSKSVFTLGAGSDGIKPLTEDVNFQLGDCSITIPAGSFKKTKHGYFVYEDVVDGITLDVQIAPISFNSFYFKFEGTGASNLPAANPVTIKLAVGDDNGTATATADFQ